MGSRDHKFCGRQGQQSTAELGLDLQLGQISASGGGRTKPVDAKFFLAKTYLRIASHAKTLPTPRSLHLPSKALENQEHSLPVLYPLAI